MRNRILVTLAICWCLSGLTFLAKLHTWHHVDLKSDLNSHIKKLAISKSWGIIHFVDIRCSCSNAIVENLLKRPALAGETLYFNKKGESVRELRDKGYQVKISDFKELNLQGIPLLVIFDPKKNLHYMGGYSDRPINRLFPPNEKLLIQKIKKQDRKRVKTLPVIGCSINKEYQEFLDPLGIKYARFKN